MFFIKIFEDGEENKTFNVKRRHASEREGGICYFVPTYYTENLRFDLNAIASSL